MAELWFDAEADAALTALESDPSRSRMFQRVQDVLDLLESDPRDARVRRVRFHRPALWCVTVFAADEEWAILWEPHSTVADVVLVHYVGPATFA